MMTKDGKANVKSLMAKFNTGGNPMEEVSGNSRPFKVPGQNSPSGVQVKKNLFNNQGNASPPAGPSNVPRFGSPKPPLGVKPSSEEKPDKEPKPPFLKPTGVNPRFGPQANSATRDPEVKPGFLKPVGPKPINLHKEDSKPAVPWPPGNKPSLHSVNQDHDLKPPGPKPGSNHPAQENEPKQVFPKLAGAKGKFMSASQDQDPTPLFPKPVFGQKPSLNTDDPQEDESPTKTVAQQRGPPAPLGAKAKSGPLKPARDDLENKERGGETSSFPFPGVVLKPAASRGSPGLSKNAEEKREDRKMDAAKNIFLSQVDPEEPASGAPPANFLKTPSKRTTAGPWGPSQEKEKEDQNSATPKRKPLPSLFILGPPPQKPSRPPHVDLTKFWKAASGNMAFRLVQQCFSRGTYSYYSSNKKAIFSTTGGTQGKGKTMLVVVMQFGCLPFLFVQPALGETEFSGISLQICFLGIPHGFWSIVDLPSCFPHPIRMAKKSTEQYERAVKNLLETSYTAGNLHVKGLDLSPDAFVLSLDSGTLHSSPLVIFQN
ncbi:hypothetical protein EI555_012746 [Monodon monoceros]|uniref:Uncharacterized protein n=1 Tax=Monodon monoceros TaxID=40151 RepID=A0A4U1EMM7_MONMO|nr:hypothetical protein EI555_012746 [Monodon monoceros]